MKFKISNPNQFHFEYQFKFTISNSPLASTNSLVRHSHSQVANFVPPFASSDSQKVHLIKGVMDSSLKINKN